MTGQIVDLERWPRAAQFRFFREYERPHFATTARIDVSHLIKRKANGISAYRGCLFAIGAGLHAVPELCMRFRNDVVVRHPRVRLSMTVPREDGSFGYAYVPFTLDFTAFDTQARQLIDAASKQGELSANDGVQDDVAYLSCMPWLDYSSINNALPGPDDCIPRVTWGKFMPTGQGWDMAMTLEVHHALVDGAHVGAFFNAVQQTLEGFSGGKDVWGEKTE